MTKARPAGPLGEATVAAPPRDDTAAGDEGAPEGTAAPLRRPWWIPPFLGSVPPVGPAAIRLLGFVALGYFFENYDMSVLLSALRHIATDLQIPEDQLGTATAWIRLGALPAFLVVPLSDRLGRRRMFLVSVIGISVMTFLTAFAPTVGWFVALQMLVRTFLLAGSAMAFVIVAEEFPAEHRGWAIGMVGTLGACGFGVGALVFSAVDILPFGWRALYAFGAAPLLFLPMLRRGVVETRRFEEGRQRRDGERADAVTGLAGAARAWLAPLAELARAYPGRAIGIAMAGGLYALAEMSVFQFLGYYVQRDRGWEPWHLSAMVILGGAVGIVANVAAGRLGDRIGRRLVGSAVMFGFPLFVWLFYSQEGWILPVAWIFLSLCSVTGNVVTRALSTEIFPTSYRGTSGGWLSLMQTLGGTSGLALSGLLLPWAGSLPQSIIWLSLAGFIAGAALWLLPETRGLELESIARDRET